jgi:NAD(P)H dehydrogenase (quinone)
MIVRSILVHPNQQSLNGELFKMANARFAELGYTVETLDLHASKDAITESSEILYKTPRPDSERKYRSVYSNNYGNARRAGLLGDFSKNELEMLQKADLVYVQTPIYVWSIPAILKLYIETVFIDDYVFTVSDAGGDKFHIEPHLKGKQVVFSFTTGGPPSMATQVLGSPEALVQPVKPIFEFVGFEWLPHHVTWGTSKSLDKCDEYFNQFGEYLNNTFPLTGR